MRCSRPGLPAPLAAVFAALSLAAAADATLPRVELKAGAHRFDVEVAATPAQRAQGLMGRSQLADNAGMLFVFEEAGRHCFWMKNTALPLSIAFLDDAGTVVGIADMQPQTRELHCAPVPVRYALELQKGGFQSRGIGRGKRFTGGPLATPLHPSLPGVSPMQSKESRNKATSPSPSVGIDGHVAENASQTGEPHSSFVDRALAARNEARITGEYFTADDVLHELDEMHAKALSGPGK